MPLDQVVFADMPELYYAAVRALQYCEPPREHPSEIVAGVLRDACPTPSSQGKHFEQHGGLSSWLHGLFEYFVVSPARGQTRKRSDYALYRH